jgi:lipoyl(octanoyl) transferase
VTSLTAELGRQLGVKDVTTAVADAVSGALDGQIRVALTQ